MNKNPLLQVRSRRTAAAVVEMAVIAPLLITLVFGIIEFGWAFMVRQMAANAAREGARTAAMQTDVDDSEIRDVVRDALSSVSRINLADEDIDVTHWCKDGAGVPDFTESVQLTIDYDDVTLLGDYFSWINFSDITVASTMRKEGVTEDSDPPGAGLCP